MNNNFAQEVMTTNFSSGTTTQANLSLNSMIILLQSRLWPGLLISMVYLYQEEEQLTEQSDLEIL